MKRLAVLVVIAAMVLPPIAAGSRPAPPIQPLHDDQFVAVAIPLPVLTEPDRRPQETLPARPAPTAPPIVVEVPVPVPAGHSLSGRASWYCKAGVSVCHYKYPPGSMVAAACAKLRRAMGSDWRGQTVTVTGPSSSVQLKLVDFCASTDKAIDLYWVAMERLGGTGVLPVTVSWR